MAKLHRDFLDLPGATDVITFDLGTDQRRRILEGEIVVCSSVAARFTRNRGPNRMPSRELERELALYVIHGVLHLAGYDDQSRNDFQKMHIREDEILSQLSYRRMFIRK